LQNRACGYAYQHLGDRCDNGLIEHLYYALRSLYDHDARYRYFINCHAGAMALHAVASRPADTQAQ
jgi:creatinine amidohydrolase/Fe(II)-dependent formamide hydrolase-like protein